MDQLSNFISEYLKTCETVQKLNSKTIKAYRIDLSQFHTFMLPLEDFTEKNTLNSFEYSCAMKSHFRKFGNQMSGSGNHLCNYASLLA